MVGGWRVIYSLAATPSFHTRDRKFPVRQLHVRSEREERGGSGQVCYPLASASRIASTGEHNLTCLVVSPQGDVTINSNGNHIY